MSKEVKISIGEHSYLIKFGYGAIRLMGKELDTKGYNETVQKVGAAVSSLSPDQKKTGQEYDIPFEVLDVLVIITQAGIENADKTQEIPAGDDLVDAMLKNAEILTTVIQAFMESMPRPKETPEPKEPTKGGKRSPRK